MGTRLILKVVTVRCSLRSIDAFEWLDAHFTLMSFVPPPEVRIPLERIAWTHLPFWDIEIGGQEIWAYSDGSFQPKDNHAGIAVALYVRQGHDWYQAGFLSSLVTPNGSYPAELSAAVIAAKAVHDLLKLIALTTTTPPTVWFCYDSLTVGQQLLGHWRCQQHPMLGRCVRLLIELIEARFSVTCQGTHIPSHKGVPGNELVDALADSAANGNVTHDLTHFFQYVVRRPFVDAGEWIWMLFAREYADKWSGQVVELQAQPETQPSAQVLPQVLSNDASDELSSHQLSLVLASGNVLTLKGHQDQLTHQQSGPTRQATVLKQLHEAGVNIFALQETRMRKLHTSLHADFLLFESCH